MNQEEKKEFMQKFWHTTAHVFANALTQIYPNARMAIGPAIENGFYYDFDLSKNLDAKDLELIEKKMREILNKKEALIQKNISIKEGTELFKNNPYKIELINDLVSEGETTLSTYTSGEFVDLCKGPHLDSTKEIKAIKLLKISAAYWKGSEKNKQLQRVYGISFSSQKELDEWILLRKKAEENSNTKLGKELDLYMISEVVGRGLPIWCPNGTIIRMQLQELLTKEQLKQGYSFLVTPHIGRTELFRKSGHLANYKESMYAPMKIDDDEYYLKPMNCPYHIMYYAKDPRSYRDLPVRLSEMGTVYRYEKSGELSGLLRVRGFTQDDAHIFCTPNQVKEEFHKVFDLVTKIMSILKLSNFRVRVGTRDPNSDKYIGETEDWEKSTREIIEVLTEKKINFEENEGDAAFYGPKADILVKDSLGREWQTGTIQLDYNLPERFNLEYDGGDGLKHRPVMIHRAPFGSFERFTGIIIEHFGGNFPLWLSPTQVRIIPVSEKFLDYAKKVKEKLIDAEVRVKLDERNETLGYKIRDAQKEKTPYLIIVGAKEIEDETISVRSRKGVQEVTTVEEFLNKILKEIREKA